MKILFIDDDKNMRKLVKYNLDLDRHNTITASSGETGILLANKEMPDLILLDIMMPEMDGIATCKALKNNLKTSSIPIFMLTAKNMMKDIEEAFDAKADSYITKPVNVEKLSDLITDKLNNLRKKGLLKDREKHNTGILESIKKIF